MAHTSNDLLRDNEEPSTLCRILENIDLLVHGYSMLVSEGAKDALLLALYRESTVVSAKLVAMRLRWIQSLPFKEVADVKFGEWHAKAEIWKRVLNPDTECDCEGYEPINADSRFFLDLMNLPKPEMPKVDCDNPKEAFRKFFSEIDEQLKNFVCKNCDDIVSSHVDEKIQMLLTKRRNSNDLRMCTIEILGKLSQELKELEDFFSSELTSDQFIILSHRLTHRDCLEAIDEGHNELIIAKNCWPEKSRKERAVDQKNKLKIKLYTELNGNELEEYIDLDFPELYADACFGQYLFKNRHKLTRQMVRDTVKYCYMICEINKLLDPKGLAKKKKDAALGRELTDDEKNILKQLESLARLGKWRNGATADSIVLGINRMLGVGFTLENDMKILSDMFWALLKKRRGCNAQKSLRLTWLNLVGWSVNEGLISGGSPSLCNDFFPNLNDLDAYKAIDKGRKHVVDAFVKIEPLLAKYLK